VANVKNVRIGRLAPMAATRDAVGGHRGV